MQAAEKRKISLLYEVKSDSCSKLGCCYSSTICEKLSPAQLLKAVAEEWQRAACWQGLYACLLEQSLQVC